MTARRIEENEKGGSNHEGTNRSSEEGEQGSRGAVERGGQSNPLHPALTTPPKEISLNQILISTTHSAMYLHC